MLSLGIPLPKDGGKRGEKKIPFVLIAWCYRFWSCIILYRGTKKSTVYRL